MRRGGAFSDNAPPGLLAISGLGEPTSRYGTPQDFRHLVDHLHQQGVGVLLDWVPSHFPSDAHGLAYFDGTHLYEHADPPQGVLIKRSHLNHRPLGYEPNELIVSSCWVRLPRSVPLEAGRGESRYV